MAARFKIDQLSPAGAGVPDRSRWDLDDGEHIFFNVVNPVVGATYAWTLIHRAGNELADGSLSSPSGTTTQIDAAKVQPPCAYVVRLTETLPSGATSTMTLCAVAMGPYAKPNLNGGMTQAEVYYMILALAGAGGGGGGADLSDDPPVDVVVGTEDAGIAEFASRADHRHKIKHRWIKQGFAAAKATDEITLVASLYFEAGTLLTPARVFLGTDTGAHQATLRLSRADNPTVLASWVANGVLQDVGLGSPLVMAAGWYQLTMVCDTPNVNAILSGIDWVYLED